MSKQSQRWAFGLACLIAAQIAASVIFRAHRFALASVSDLVQCTALFCATYSSFLNISRTSQRARLFWVLMSLGTFSWFSYQLLWTYIEVVQRSEVPNMFAGDAVLFLHFVPMMAAIALQPNIRTDDRELRIGSLDFAVLLLWWVYIYIYTILPWEYVHVDESAYAHNLNQAYLVEKIAFLTAVAMLWIRSSGAWKNMYAHWFGAGVLYSMSSYIANWALNHNLYYSGSVYDVPLVVSMAWMAVPGLLGLNAPVGQAAPKKFIFRGVWTARLGMIAVFSLPFFAYLSVFDGSVPAEVRNFRMLLTLTAILLMGGFVFLKQHLLDVELIQLLGKSRQSFQDLQTLQAQLVQSEKLASLGNLVGGAAHELNNPLTAILGYSDLLTATELSQQQRTLAEKISHQAKRIRGMVASLLSFAKQSPSFKGQLDVNSVIEKALTISQGHLRAANVRCQFQPAQVMPQVLGDSNQLLQVFSHIISNAANAMEEKHGGTLTIATRTFGKTISIDFSDDGPGIENPEKVFDPFYTTRPVGQGMGLGLSMCYGIVQEHGGKITCRNREDGGATFLIDLPVSSEAVRNEGAHAHAQAAK